MTNLELVAQIGAESVDLANMYLNGHLSVRELNNILGKRRTELILLFGEGKSSEKSWKIIEDKTGKIGLTNQET